MAVEIRYEKADPPEELLKCAGWPPPPNPHAGQDMDSDSVEYQEKGKAAHADCAGKIEELRRFYQGE